MPNRITEKDLEMVLLHLNDLTNNPINYWKDDETLEHNEGHFYIEYAYGGCRLSQLCKQGARDISPFRGTKKQIYTFIQAMITGIQFYKDSQ